MIGTIAPQRAAVSVAVVALGKLLHGRNSQRPREWLQLVYGAVYTNFMLVTCTLRFVALVTHDFRGVRRSGGKRSTPAFTIISCGERSKAPSFLGWVLAIYGCRRVAPSSPTGNLIPTPQ